MPNINKVIFGNQTLIDLSTTTLSSTDQLESGVTAYDRAGNVITGTSTGGGAGGITQDQDGYLVLDDDAPQGGVTVEPLSVTANGTYTATSGHAYSPVTVNVPSGGGGGLEYEEGTWEPSEDVVEGEVLFANSHTDPPVFFMMADGASRTSTTTYSNHGFVFAYDYKALGATLYMNSSNIVHAVGVGSYRSSSSTGMNNSGLTYLSTQISTRVTNEAIYPRCNSSSYWRAGRTYKWIAVWAPTA